MRVSAPSLVLATLPLLTLACNQPHGLPTERTDPAVAKADAAPQRGVPGVSSADVKLKADQSNMVSAGLGVGTATLLGQTFTPNAKSLAQIDLRFIVNSVPPAGLPATVGLFDDLTSSPLATASVTVPPASPGELSRVVSFRFASPIPLTKKGSYTIGLYPTGSPSTGNLSWELSFGDPYPLGEAVGPDSLPLSADGDFLFTTYELK